MSVSVNIISGSITNPNIRWQPAKSEYEVRFEMQKKSRKLGLYSESKEIASILYNNIKLVGYCFQCWFRKNNKFHQELRLFISGYDVCKEKYEGYTVLADLKNGEICAYPEFFTKNELKDRIFYKEPNLNRNLIYSILPSSSLPSWIGWKDIEKKMPWSMSFEKSEEGLVRTWSEYSHTFEEKVLYSNYSVEKIRSPDQTDEFAKEPQIVRYSERKVNFSEVISIVCSILKKDGSLPTEAYKAYNKMKLSDGNTQNIQISNTRDLSLLQRALNKSVFTYIPEHRGYLVKSEQLNTPYTDFMDNSDLQEKSLNEIVKIFSSECCVVRNPENLSQMISFFGPTSTVEAKKVVHSFVGYNEARFELPAVKLTIKESIFSAIINSTRSLIPEETCDRIFEAELEEEALKEIIALNELTKEAKDELIKARVRSATVEIFISFNRAYVEVKVDKSLYKGYSIRKSLVSGYKYLAGVFHERN